MSLSVYTKLAANMLRHIELTNQLRDGVSKSMPNEFIKDTREARDLIITAYNVLSVQYRHEFNENHRAARNIVITNRISIQQLHDEVKMAEEALRLASAMRLKEEDIRRCKLEVHFYRSLICALRM